MIAIKDMKMPTSCDRCIIRRDCARYKQWYYGHHGIYEPKPGSDECRLIDLSKYEDDGK